jgi:S-adenosylmethionine decarboxylase
MSSFRLKMDTGQASVVDAYGCDAEKLADTAVLNAVFDAVVRDLDLHPLGPPVFHEFPGPGGVSGFLLLSESHLSCHTFPEKRYAAFDLYCCRGRVGWAWAERLKDFLGATDVQVRRLERGERLW